MADTIGSPLRLLRALVLERGTHKEPTPMGHCANPGRPRDYALPLAAPLMLVLRLAGAGDLRTWGIAW